MTQESRERIEKIISKYHIGCNLPIECNSECYKCAAQALLDTGYRLISPDKLKPLSEVLNQLKGIYNQAVDLGVLETMLREYIETLEVTVDSIKKQLKEGYE